MGSQKVGHDLVTKQQQASHVTSFMFYSWLLSWFKDRVNFKSCDSSWLLSWFKDRVKFKSSRAWKEECIY